MAFSNLAANQMVPYSEVTSGGFSIKSGQTNPNTSQCLTKDMAFTMFNLAPTAGSNGIAGNQLMQKSFWQAAISEYTGNLIVGSISNKQWGYGSDDNGKPSYGTLTPFSGITLLKNGYITGISWYVNIFSFTVSHVPESTPPFDWDTILINGVGYNRTDMSWLYDGYRHWFTISTAINPLGTVNGAAKTVKIIGAFIGSGDTTAPTAPTNLVSSLVTQSSVRLTWSAATDAVGVTNYHVSRNGSPLISLGTVLSYDVTGLTASTAYSFNVYARDAAGNVSPASNTVNITTSAPVDATPPNNVTNVSISNVGTTTLDLTWTCSTDNVGIAGYKIYVNGPSNLIATVNTSQSTGNLSYGITGLNPNTSYYFVVRAYDAAGNHASGASSTTITTGNTATIYEFPISNSTATDANFACMMNLDSICYSTSDFIEVGSYIYKNTDMTTPYHTGNKFAQLLFDGFQYVIQTSWEGQITAINYC